MSEKNFPNWMLAAVVFGFGELTYWLWKQWGFGLVTKTALGATIVVSMLMLLVYVQRVVRRQRVLKQQGQKKEKFENMTH